MITDSTGNRAESEVEIREATQTQVMANVSGNGSLPIVETDEENQTAVNVRTNRLQSELSKERQHGSALG